MDPAVIALARAQFGVVSRGQCLRAGLASSEVRALRTDGRLEPLRSGAYLVSGEASGLDPRPLAQRSPQDRALLAAVAGWLAGPPRRALSHHSAAVALGLPWVGQLPDDVQLTDELWGGRRAGIRVHRRPLPPGERHWIARIPMTAPWRTAWDVAAGSGFAAGVVVADAAFRLAGGSPPPEWWTARGSTRGAAAARRIFAFADGAAESAGESLARVRMAEHGLPVPVLQWVVLPAGSPGGGIRTDFGWPEEKVAGEFDGRSKYRDVDDLWSEREREQRLRDLGVTVVRFTWDDVWRDFGRAAARLQAALAAGRRAA